MGRMQSKKKLPTAFINVDYEEFKTETYNGITVLDYETKKVIYSANTGNFLEDRDTINLIVGHNENYTFFNLSSMDDFMMDLPVENKLSRVTE